MNRIVVRHIEDKKEKSTITKISTLQRTVVVVVAVIFTFLLFKYAKEVVNRNELNVDDRIRPITKTLVFGLSIEPGFIGNELFDFPAVGCYSLIALIWRHIMKDDNITLSENLVELTSEEKRSIEMALGKLKYILLDNPKEGFMRWIKSEDFKIYKKEYEDDVLEDFWAFHFLDMNVIFIGVSIISFIFWATYIFCNMLFLIIVTMVEFVINLRAVILKKEERVEDEEEKEIYENIKEKIRRIIYDGEEARGLR
ncbi:hypothetical protein Calkro_0016 [Caldicellulosiruptor kronotskyensis 2002]|uniref:Uncharacterized protein n=1 Tax=Caldicellulosiruptor kronotskyensis (strain DSM 18902 / VKM B-2412 / 2002) TaxID=632348 RepID=E4SC11_CALK2|nr:hypothetical protein [Caldicellulosiruptor kronotskyensis]ADQ44936.1 hypothetical protein Calkro_0016 [Caldicellulosiruptor kronotskyensis 2002]